MTAPQDRQQVELAALFAEYNNAYFEGELVLPTFLRFDSMLRGFDGWAYYAEAGPSKRILVVSHEARRRGRRFYGDTLLHEMVHLAVALLDGGASQYNRHDHRFAQRANAIASALGLDSIAADSAEANQWPQTLRPKGYYESLD
jgi:hypothetical protein